MPRKRNGLATALQAVSYAANLTQTPFPAEPVQGEISGVIQNKAKIQVSTMQEMSQFLGFQTQGLLDAQTLLESVVGRASHLSRTSMQVSTYVNETLQYLLPSRVQNSSSSAPTSIPAFDLKGMSHGPREVAPEASDLNEEQGKELYQKSA